MENEWRKCNTHVFWGEIAPCDHVVQIYESNDVFMESLQHFAGGGLRAGDCVIIIATAAHLKSLKDRLETYGVDPMACEESGQFIAVDAEKALAVFMRNGWPDEALFNMMVNELFARGRQWPGRIRAFGEMVAILWAQGHNGATVQLEHLWNKFCATEAFSLFCAYPKSGFTQDPAASMLSICATHSKVIAGHAPAGNELSYKCVNRSREQ